jgi:Fur family ferric uptake transcriptional regulator
MKPTPHQTAEAALRRTGARVTRARIEILALLLREPQALTHQQIEKRLARSRGIDRVTIYRVLEWLVKHGLAHKIAVGERAWRFDAVDPDHAHRHAHFQCDRCGTVTCLEGFRDPPSVKLPAGFRSSEIELTVKGVCAGCAPAGGKAGRRPRALQPH